MTRRDRRHPAVITIWWRDIPAQVNGLGGAQREQVLLPWRFQWAIECAAKKADLTDVHEFTKQWRRTEITWDGDITDPRELAQAARATAAQLEAAYDQPRLDVLVLSGGVELPADSAPLIRPRVTHWSRPETTP
jgi:hypothetical protein